MALHRLFKANDVLERRIYRLESDFALSVAVIESPSKAQVRVMIERLRAAHGAASLRGSLIDGSRLLLWDAWALTHDEVGRELYPDVSPYSAALSTFEITEKGFRYVKPGAQHPLSNPLVQQVLDAVGAAG